jgi:hypothetical protein
LLWWLQRVLRRLLRRRPQAVRRQGLLRWLLWLLLVPRLLRWLQGLLRWWPQTVRRQRLLWWLLRLLVVPRLLRRLQWLQWLLRWWLRHRDPARQRRYAEG